MTDLLNFVLTEIRSSWRFRWVAIAVAWLVCLIGWAVVFWLPDQYEAEARFYVDTSTRTDEILEGVVIESDESSQVAIVRQKMLLTPNLDRVARETDLDLRASTIEEKEELLQTLARKINIQAINVRRGKEDGVYRISFRDRDRSMALKVVDEMLDTFREDVVSNRAAGSDDAVEFLQSGIEEYKKQLQDQEQALAQFKRENVGLLPGEGRGYFETLQQAFAENRAIQAELDVLRERRQALAAQLRGGSPIIDDPDTPGSIGTGTDIDMRIENVESTIQALLTRYTEKWPDVIAARDQLKQLYEQRDRQLEELANAGEGGVGVPSNNPVYQQIQISLNEADIQIAELEGRLAGSRAEVRNLEEKIDIIPQVEAELAELTRDYEQINTVYNDMRQRLEQESLRRKRLGWDGVTFETMEPPRANTQPVAPMRSQLLFAVVFLALGAGGGAAYLLNLIKPVFVDVATMRRELGLPVLGAVSMAWEAEHRSQRKRELTIFAGAAVTLLVAAVILLVFQDLGVQASNELKRMASL